MDISVVIPLFNEEESLPELYAWIERVMQANGFSFEVIFVNDGSTALLVLAVLPTTVCLPLYRRMRQMDKDGNTINNQYIPARAHALNANVDYDHHPGRATDRYRFAR